MRMMGMMLLVVGMAGAALATVGAPEVDPGSAGSALTLLSGALLVIKSRRKK